MNVCVRVHAHARVFTKDTLGNIRGVWEDCDDANNDLISVLFNGRQAFPARAGMGLLLATPFLH